MKTIKKFYNVKITIISVCLLLIYLLVTFLNSPEVCYDGYDEVLQKMQGGCEIDYGSLWVLILFGIGIFMIGYVVLSLLYYFYKKEKK